MATRTPTYRYSDVLSAVEESLPKRIGDQFAGLACNLATNLIWYAYDWRESLEELPPFFLVPGEQDHGTPFSTIPSDFHGLREVRLCQYRGDTSPVKTPVKPIQNLDLTHVYGLPQSVCYEASVDAFRVFPRVPINIGAPEWWIEGTYKKRPADITNASTTSLLPFDDMYFNVWVDAIRWAFLKLSGSQQAGEANVTPDGRIVYTGQLGTAVAGIQQMASTEGFNLGASSVHPSEPLVYGNQHNVFGILGPRW